MFPEATITALGWIGMIITLIAIHLLGKKEKEGWVFQIIGNVAWIIVGIATSYGLVILNIIITIIAIKSYRRWDRDEMVDNSR